MFEASVVDTEAEAVESDRYKKKKDTFSFFHYLIMSFFSSSMVQIEINTISYTRTKK